jgi:hypothetical protein
MEPKAEGKTEQRAEEKTEQKTEERMEPETNEQAGHVSIRKKRSATFIGVKMWKRIWQYVDSRNEIDKTDRVKICIGVVGVLGTALGFSIAYLQLFVLFQSTQAQYLSAKAQYQSTKIQALQLLSQPGDKIQKAFIEHPELRPYFYENKPFRREDKNYQAVAIIAEMYLDWFDSFGDDDVAQLPKMEPGGEQRLLWEQYFRDMFESSEALRVMGKERVRSGWYYVDFTKYMPPEDAATTDTSNMPTEAPSQ